MGRLAGWKEGREVVVGKVGMLEGWETTRHTLRRLAGREGRWPVLGRLAGRDNQSNVAFKKIDVAAVCLGLLSLLTTKEGGVVSARARAGLPLVVFVVEFFCFCFWCGYFLCFI